MIDWAYRRFGPRYLAAILAVDVVAAIGTALGAVVLVALYQHMSALELTLVGGVAGLSVGCAACLALWRVRPMVVPLLGWAAGDPRALPEAAWRCALELPLALVRNAGLAPLLIGGVPGIGCVAVIAELQADEVAVLAAVAAVTLAYAVALHVFAAELALRPVVRDLAGKITAPSGEDRPYLSLRVKLLVTLPLINVISGIAVAALVPGGERSLSDLGVTMLLAGAVSATVAFVLTGVVSGSILGAVGELTGATRRVGAGDLSRGAAVSSTDELGRLGDSFNQMIVELSERAILREALQTYVHPQVADRVVDEGVVLSGEEVDVTVVFIDVRGFTAFAAEVDADAAVASLNAFLAEVLPRIYDRGGYADKFVGDGVLAVFGARERAGDHAERAVAAARDIASALESHADGWRVGIGINSGRVLAGTIGAQDHYEFTVIGDVVNVAARIEGLTRSTGDTILVSESTRDRLRAQRDLLLPRGARLIRGKREPVVVYAVADGAS